MSTTRIIIVGGGFGGVSCAKTLSRELSGQAELVLFNRENHLVFSPLLAEAVGSSVNPLDIVVPLRQMLPRVFCRTEEVQSVDLEGSAVEYETEECQLCRMTYDHLVIACGSAANLQVVPGMADYAFPLKTVGDAIELRAHVMEEMEKAEVSRDPERRRWHLTFIVVGGGYTGVEVAGEIHDLVCSSLCYFQNFREEDVTVILIHSGSQILPEIRSELREFARKKMEEAGVNVRLKTCVTRATPEGVTLQNGEFVKGGTIVCTIGNSAPPLVERLDVPKDKGRLVTRADMRLPSWPNVWALGDCALVINAYDDKPSPPTGQFAERQGRQCAHNIVAMLQFKGTKPFCFKQLGELCSIGGHSAVGELFGLKLAGFLAWFIWRGVYLFKLPSWDRRLQVGFDWAMLLLFPRDLSHIRDRRTDRVSHARYKSGDVIFQQGEPRLNFYVIVRGQVEVARGWASEGEHVTVRGPGSFFGEGALFDNGPRASSARARTSVEVLVMGRNALTQLSPKLAPFREALAQTLNHRTPETQACPHSAAEAH